MPDRVNVEGRAIYSPGGEQVPLADHALDNAPFMAMLACNYFDLADDAAFFSQIEPALRRGLDHIRRDDSGLVYTPSEKSQCPYGFTDTIAKSGHLLFSSLLYYHACRRMERACLAAGSGDADAYCRSADLIAAHLDLLWNEDEGMFWAADQDCRQIDIWGSALAVHLECISDSQSARICAWLVEHYDGIVQRGQVRHLPAGQLWQRFFKEGGVEAGTYQNGAFWATPLAWVVPTIARCDRELAVATIAAAIADFREFGIAECVNGDYCKVPNFVVSATSVYSLLLV
jgi:hypothetical protein